MKNTLLDNRYSWGLTGDQFKARHGKPKKKRKKREFGLGKRKVENWTIYSEYCKSKAFKMWRMAVLRKYKFKCVICKKRANVAHHIKYTAKWGTEPINDGVAVCQYHHEVFHYDKEVMEMMKKQFD